MPGSDLRQRVRDWRGAVGGLVQIQTEAVFGQGGTPAKPDPGTPLGGAG